MLNFNFLEKDLGLVFQSHFILNLKKKKKKKKKNSRVNILLTDQISLSDCLLEILGNMCITIV